MGGNKEYFEMTDKHIVDAKHTDRQRWAVALLLRESGKYTGVSVQFGNILVIKIDDYQRYKCSIELHNWQERAAHSKPLGPITVVLDNDKMTAYIFKDVK